MWFYFYMLIRGICKVPRVLTEVLNSKPAPELTKEQEAAEREQWLQAIEREHPTKVSSYVLAALFILIPIALIYAYWEYTLHQALKP